MSSVGCRSRVLARCLLTGRSSWTDWATLSDHGGCRFHPSQYWKATPLSSPARWQYGTRSGEIRGRRSSDPYFGWAGEAGSHPHFSCSRTTTPSVQCAQAHGWGPDLSEQRLMFFRIVSPLCLTLNEGGAMRVVLLLLLLQSRYVWFCFHSPDHVCHISLGVQVARCLQSSCNLLRYARAFLKSYRAFLPPPPCPAPPLLFLLILWLQSPQLASPKEAACVPWRTTLPFLLCGSALRGSVSEELFWGRKICCARTPAPFQNYLMGLPGTNCPVEEHSKLLSAITCILLLCLGGNTWEFTTPWRGAVLPFLTPIDHTLA